MDPDGTILVGKFRANLELVLNSKNTRIDSNPNCDAEAKAFADRRTPNASVREVSSLRPRLREDLCFSIQEQGTKRVCIIEDPVLSRFYRIGIEEYCFLRELDGTQTIAAILTRLAQRADGQTFSEAEALEVLQWLRQNDLLVVASNVINKHQDEAKLWKASSWLNPLLLRIPLARPDRFFAWSAARIRVFLGPFGFAIWLSVVI